jgi:molecular chaperone HscB
MSDYFTLLGLPAEFNLDLAALESAYFREQRVSHPDRFVGKPAAERQAALSRSVEINEAYNHLKDPLKRAQYLLHLQGIEVGTEADSVKPSASLLMETMELRERIEEAAPEELSALEDSLAHMTAQAINAIDRYYGAAEFNEMAEETLRLGYLLKIREEAAKRKQRLKQAS